MSGTPRLFSTAQDGTTCSPTASSPREG
jgi:hypothetical protein